MNINNLGGKDKDFCYYQGYYFSHDPRLKDINGLSLLLDSAPRNGKVNDPINNPYDGNVTTRYATLADIHLGDIQYYINPELSTPFLPVNFPNVDRIEKKIHINSMGTITPVFSLFQTPSHSLSWINDSNRFRQEILALNMTKRNQTDYQIV